MKRKVMSVLMVGILMFSLSACCSATRLVRRTTGNSWSVSFGSLNGELTHRVKVRDGKPTVLKVESSVQQGKLTLLAHQHDISEEILLGTSEIDVSEWTIGNHIIIRIKAESAKDGYVNFVWE